MSVTAIILLLIAASTHAGWNFLGKRACPTTSFFLLANTVGVLCLLPVVLLNMHLVAAFPARVWGFLLLTGVFQALYYFGLAGAYRSGDISVAYPFARSMPVVIMTLVMLAIGRGGQLTVQCLLGIIIVVIGGLVLPTTTFSQFRKSDYFNMTCVLALLAAIGTAGYSMTDDVALRQLRTLHSMAGLTWQVTVVYSFFECLSASVLLACGMFLLRPQRQLFLQTWRKDIRPALLTGVGITFSYTLVLIAMAFAKNVVYVMVLRQLSIPFGAMLGISLLHERAYPPKLVGIAMMFIGIILVATG